MSFHALISLSKSHQFLRLGFHDCIPYVDGAESDDHFNGCDGCLNDHFVGVDILHAEDGGLPDSPETNNNGLLPVADFLEEMYRNAKFPEGFDNDWPSLYATGKSRADLWAFATLAAAEFALQISNKGCEVNGTGTSRAKHYKELAKHLSIHR